MLITIFSMSGQRHICRKMRQITHTFIHSLVLQGLYCRKARKGLLLSVVDKSFDIKPVSLFPGSQMHAEKR